MEPAQARPLTVQVAQILLTELTRTGNVYQRRNLAQALEAVVVAMEPQQGAQFLLTQLSGTDPSKTLPHLENGLRLVASRMSKQDLVNTLKNPLCVGRAQRILLLEFGQRCGRRFDGLWDLVSWAERQEPALDLASPFRMSDHLSE